MFTEKKKLFLIITILFVMSFVSVVLYADCDMMAMIAKKGHYLSWNNSSYDLFNFIRERSTNSGWKPNNDGYGFSYYPEDGSFFYNLNNPNDPDNQAWYLTGEDNYFYNLYNPNDPDNVALDTAEQIIMDNDTEATIIYGHARSAGSSYVDGSHPFRFEWDGKTYTFMHNGGMNSDVGDLRDKVIEYLGASWSYPSNWSSNSVGDDWIDSEVFFHYLMKHIIAVEGDVLNGIYNALNYSVGYPQNNVWDLISNPENYYNIINFVFSDGESLYLFRNRNDNTHEYSYKEFNGFYTVKTYEDLEEWETLDDKELAIISPYGVSRIPNIMKDYPFDDSMQFVRGEITDDLNCGAYDADEPMLWFTSNVTIPSGVTVNIVDELYEGTHVGFATNITMTINGTLKINEGASLNINHASQVLVENDGILFLDWGSTLTGSSPTTVEATPPGYPVGGEAQIPGDRIIAKNGGRITTKTKIQYDEYVLSHGEEPSTINITSSFGIPWDGIFIQNPSNLSNYWFVNCDIEEIQKLSIEDVSLSARNIANLNLYQTDFHDAGQVVVRDGHKLSIQGIEGDLCHFYNTPAYPIIAYESQVDLSYVHIGGIVEGDGLENGGGIYLYDTAGNGATINNCDITYNNTNGVRLNGAHVEFHHNIIKYNNNFGMLCFDGTLFIGDFPFDNINIQDNGYAEYAGWQSTFNMGEDRTDINLVDTDDGLLLMNLNWDDSTEVDIRGTNITSADLPYLFPSDPDAWTFGGGGITPEEELLYAAANDMGNGNYTTAEQTLQLLISDYPLTKEAGTAVYYLYHLENLTAQDFSGLREYLENITPPSNSSLEMAIKKIITKTYMKDKEYLIAIDLLETTINNSQIPDEVISAMIDQGYCYMELADEGERGLPANCTIKTATLDEYQAKVRELESQFSFYPEEQDPNTTLVARDILSVTNFPNPFNPTTTISFNLTAESNVDIAVYNVKGQKVKQLMNEQLPVGQHSIEWNGKDSNNKATASGIYFYKISAGKSTSMKKMLLLK
ncbi:MAG: T9SS type A sorting domain-containing protein [Candidatus Tenebribacter burtonii]|nr:T9SS type A sorting domain-containing protein [Candidatus Tenebribacter burtonii]